MGSTSTQKQSSTNTSNTTTTPSQFQQPFLDLAFDQARNALGKTTGIAGPENFTAQFSPEMMAAFRTQMGYGMGNSDLSGASSDAGYKLATAGADAATAGLYGLLGYKPQGGVGANIDAASQYANNPAVSGMVSAAMRDANQNYTDVQNPALVRFAAGSGNINSTAPAVQQGIMERGLAQKAADISSTLRGNLFQRGLELNADQSKSNNEGILRAMLGATQGGTSAALGGVDAFGRSIDQQKGLFGIANSGISNLLGGDQAALTNLLQRYQFGTNSPFDALNNYWNIVGGKMWGSNSNTVGSSNSTTTSKPSTMQQIGQIAGMVGSFI